MITDSQLNGYSERFLDFVKNSSGNEIITLHKLSYIVRQDSMIQMFFSKLNFYDIVRVIYYTYFLSKGVKQDDIFIFLDKIYIYILNDYDDKSYISVECSQCYGEGHYGCLECDGTGNETCYTCDGDKSVNCEECSGSGKEQCYYCEGEGSKTEEDSKGNEVEVNCWNCDGKGKHSCSGCYGDGNYVCDDCLGRGTIDCRYCEGSGTQYCDTCNGRGNYESEELYYTDNSFWCSVTLDSSIFRFENKPMEDEDFLDDLENYFNIKFTYLQNDVPVDGIDSEYGTDDLDRVVVVSNISVLTDSNSDKFYDAKFF